MHKFLLIFWLFPCVLLGQNSDKESDFGTITVKIIDDLDENYLDAPFSIIDTEDNVILNSKDTLNKYSYTKIREGHYQIFLPRNGQKYEILIDDYELENKLYFDESFGFGKIHTTHDSTYIR